ncbi:hypothetical protein ACWCPI_16465 [Streptomyces sp. NPDC001920]
MLPAMRGRGVVSATVVLGGLVTATVLTAKPALLVGAPMMGALWTLVVLDSGYLLGREWAHRRRRRASRPQRDAWAPEPGVLRPIDHPVVVPRPAGGAQEDRGGAVDQQGRFRATGIRLAVLPALAVLCLTVQTVFLKHDSALGLGFVCAECLLLLVMIWTVWTEQEPSRPWVLTRTRTELFRREMFLVVGQAGPYLGLSVPQAERVRDARLNLLAHAGAAQLDEFARLSDRGADGAERHWRDEAWRRAGTADADTTARMRTYLDHRIRRQALYFELAADKCERTEKSLTRIAKGGILGGIAVALSYAALLVAGHGRDERSSAAMVVALLAAVLPPLCNSVLAVQNLFAAQRLASSYRETRRELLGYENTLRALIGEQGGSPGPDSGAAFRALVVGVETALTEELRRWRIVVAKPEFDAGL